MKTLYIPKGESRIYESINIDRIVVQGSLDVKNGLKAKRITGHGIISAGAINADVIVADDIETARITCKRLMAKRVYAAEVYASDSAVVSCSLTAAYVETGKLTTALSEIDEVKADEVVNLRPRRRGMLLTLLASAFLSLWLSLTTRREEPKPEKDEKDGPISVEEAEAALDRAADFGDGSENAMKEYIGKTVREIMEENGLQTDDLGLRRIVSCYLLLRDKGYTLHISPVEASENDTSVDDQAQTAEKAA